MGVAIGLVEGVMAPIIPIGLAISIIPFFLSSNITPVLLTFFKSLNNPSVFLWFLIILSSTFPSLVLFTAN